LDYIEPVKKIYNRLFQTLLDFLKQGKSPRELALAVSLGVIIGMFPIQGTTTMICIAISLIFRLNLVVIQIANYLSIPLMIAMQVPMYSLGHRLFNTRPYALKGDEILLLFQHDFPGTLGQLSRSVLYATFMWLILAPIMGGIIYYISLRIIKRMKFEVSE